MYDKAGDDVEERKVVKQEKEVVSSAGYPSSQVAKLIQERAEPADREELRTPVDLQDIVEKLNSAIKDCRMKNNLKLAELSPNHQH